MLQEPKTKLSESDFYRSSPGSMSLRCSARFEQRIGGRSLAMLLKRFKLQLTQAALQVATAYGSLFQFFSTLHPPEYQAPKVDSIRMQSFLFDRSFHPPANHVLVFSEFNQTKLKKSESWFSHSQR